MTNRKLVVKVVHHNIGTYIYIFWYIIISVCFFFITSFQIKLPTRAFKACKCFSYRDFFGSLGTELQLNLTNQTADINTEISVKISK